MLNGTVTCIRHAAEPSESEYYISGDLDGRFGIAQCKSGVVLRIGEEVSAELEGGMIGSAIVKGSGTGMERARDGAHSLALELVGWRGSADAKEIEAVSKAMAPKLQKAATFMIEKILAGSPVIVRFHNDADGSSGAYALYRALLSISKRISICGSPAVSWKMHRGVAYDMMSAEEDTLTANSFESTSKPLLIIIDFGTSVESNSGISVAKDKFDIIWLDHHPIEEGFEGKELDYYINPWLFGGDSNYTAGLLSCTFSSTFSDLDFSEEREASLIGDYSSFATMDEKGRKLSLLLDMLTSDKRIALKSGGDITPMEIGQILSDKGRRDELTRYASMKLDEAIDSGLSSVRQYKSGKFNVYLLDFENVRDAESTTKYPLPGRYASKLLERIESLSDKPCILMLHFGSFISIRVSKGAAEGVDIVGTVKELKSGYKEITAAGGHSRAMSIKLAKPESKREVINMLLRSLGCSVG